MLTLPPKPYEDNRQVSIAEKGLSPADEFHAMMKKARLNTQRENAEMAQQLTMPLDEFSSARMRTGVKALAPESAPASTTTPIATQIAATPFSIPDDDILFDDCYLSVLNLLVQQLMEAVLVVDARGTIKMINAKAIELLSGGKLGASDRLGEPENIIGKTWQEYLREPQKTRYQQMLEEQLVSQCQLDHAPIEASLILAEGGCLDVEFSISYLSLSSPVFAIVIRDLTKHKSEYQQLYQWASTDCLTKLANRRVFDASLRTQWQACTASAKPISVVIIDIDHFKLFNDKYGHIQGDHCLQRIANVIAHSLPSDECVAARYGGEEFALILPGFDAKQAEQMAEYIQLEINSLKYTDLGLDESVTVSVSQGIAAEVDGQFRTGTALLCAADTALYRAKADGRNRINLSC